MKRRSSSKERKDELSESKEARLQAEAQPDAHQAAMDVRQSPSNAFKEPEIGGMVVAALRWLCIF